MFWLNVVFCISCFIHQLLEGYQTRDHSIKRCITEVSNSVRQLREKRDANADDFQAIKDLRKEQTKVTTNPLGVLVRLC